MQKFGSYLKIHYSGPDPCQDISQDFGRTRLPLPLIEMPLNLVTRSQNSVKQQCLEKIIYKLLTIFLSSVISMFYVFYVIEKVSTANLRTGLISEIYLT